MCIYVHHFFHVVRQPIITDIIITPFPPLPPLPPHLLHQLNDAISLTCTAEGGPRIMTRWQFNNGSSVVTVANGNSSVTYNVTSLSTEHTGVYYCEAMIDNMTDTSMNYTLFGEYVFYQFLSVCQIYHCKIHMGQKFSGIPNLVNFVMLVILGTFCHAITW